MDVFIKRLRVIQKCCCCSLEVGALIILWTWICFALIALIGLLVLWSDVNYDLDSALKSKFYDMGRREKDSYSSYNLYTNVNYVDTSDLHHYVYSKVFLLSLMFYILLFQLCPHIFALCSIHKRKPSYLEPYIYVKISEFLFVTATIIILVVSFFVVVNATGLRMGNVSYEMIWSAFFTSIYLVINYYCTNVVYSCYVKMKEENRNHQNGVELTTILPAGNSVLQNPSVSQPVNNQSFINDMSSLPIKNQFANNVTPSAPVENQPFIQHKDYNFKFY